MKREVWTPGRVNLIGEHIDYHGLPVLPIAIARRIRVHFEPRDDARIRVTSCDYGTREFEWTQRLQPVAAGDWENYLRAAAQAVAVKWGNGRGIEAEIESDLPPAAGLSSSSALIVAVTLALLDANRQQASFEELMEVLPEGEHFVGTRGGGMDHAAVLASRAGCATLIGFDPVSVRHVPVPPGWGFLVAHSLQTAEKSGGAKEAYNARRQAGFTALKKIGLRSYREALNGASTGAERLLTQEEKDAFEHTTTEARRVQTAVAAMEAADADTFGRVLLESHASLRDGLHVSSPALDALVDAAVASGALGARLTGAGFGGCVVVFAKRSELAGVRKGLMDRFYAGRPGFLAHVHLLDAEPGPGALNADSL